ncbi:MAG: GTP-binding protein [Pseudomonadota bacterium]
MSFPLPVTVLTGFPGSGKTTRLKSLLQSPAMTGTVVIVNECGEVGLDDALVEARGEDMIMLPSGCVCCAVGGDLVTALKSLADRAMGGEIGELKRLVVETSGLADPAPIALTLMTEDDLFRLYRHHTAD